jgi:hypothetical protein
VDESGWSVPRKQSEETAGSDERLALVAAAVSGAQQEMKQSIFDIKNNMDYKDKDSLFFIYLRNI